MYYLLESWNFRRFLVFRNDGAKDWNSNLLISVNHQGRQHHLQFHHIFPKAVLKNKYTVREVNDITNLSFIGGKTNRKISNKKPEVYFGEILAKQGGETFQKQCIPTNITSTDDYPRFIEERRKLIAQRLNRFLEEIIR